MYLSLARCSSRVICPQVLVEELYAGSYIANKPDSRDSVWLALPQDCYVVWLFMCPRSRVRKLIGAFEARECNMLSGDAELCDLDRWWRVDPTVQNKSDSSNHWKNLCAETERVDKELTMKADEDIWWLKKILLDMTLSNYWFEEKIEKLVQDLEVAEDNVLDQHEFGFQMALQQTALLYSFEWGKVRCRKRLLSRPTYAPWGYTKCPRSRVNSSRDSWSR